MKTFYTHAFLFFLNFQIYCVHSQALEKPNFILIISDDLNDYVNPINNDIPQISTPNIQQLADSGMIFMNAFANAPGCAPSRTSFLSGKDLIYTQVYTNDDYINSFRLNFTAAKGNQEVFTLPQVLKDSGGYYTYAINKIFHNPDNNDYDKVTEDPCSKIKSWSHMIINDPSDSSGFIDPIIAAYSFDPEYFQWGPVPDSLESKLTDHIAADSAILFLQNYASGAEPACDKPFFLALGMNYPHSLRFVPESYFPEGYMKSIYEVPFDYPFNYPVGSYPYNGIVMPPQPDTMYGDYYNFPDSGVARIFADFGEFYGHMNDYYDNLDVIPEIDPSFDDSTRKAMILEAVKADYVINYIAAVQFVDAMIGRVLNELYAHPEIAENTIIIFVGDHGYSLGEKRHWEKWGMWDTDIRIPFIVVDPSKTPGQVSDNPVALLDLFPTVCDLADVNYPKFSDGSDYLDGASFISSLSNPALMCERPVLTSYKKESGPTSCNPTYSVRNSRFHFIQYKLNNAGDLAVGYCDSTFFGYEEELYDVGTNREYDLHEWNNLAGEKDYEPLIDYFHQFLPDSSLYMQTTYSAAIKSNALPCLLTHDDTLFLSFDWIDSAGTIVEPSPDYSFRWTTNLTGDTVIGNEFIFDIASIPDDLFTSQDKVIVYLQAFDSDSNIVAFDMEYYYINPANEPSATFNLFIDTTETAHIIDFDITGSYSNYYWDFGTGMMSVDAIPGPYTYAEPGLHAVTLYIEYGNGCMKTVTRDNGVFTDEQESTPSITLLPVPADQSLYIIALNCDQISDVSVFNSAGEKVSNLSFDRNNTRIRIDTSGFPNGYYVVRIGNVGKSESEPFIVIHQ